MSDYTKTTNFTAKDALASGDANKKIKGSLFDTEYDAISTAIATKEDSANKNTASGYCPLDASTLVPLANIPTTLTGKSADLLDGVEATSFLRSDAADTATGNLTFSGTATFNGGAYAGSDRLTRTVVLDTPIQVLEVTAPYSGSWVTVANSTLQTANAIAVLLNFRSIANSGTTFGDVASIVMYAQPTGAGWSQSASYCNLSYARAANLDSTSTYYQATIDTNNAIVPLDGSSRFDYDYTLAETGGASASGELYIVGYITEV